MIARIWHGWTKRADAKVYEELLRDEIFPSIAARKINGYRGAELFIRDQDEEVEFMTLRGETIAVTSLSKEEVRPISPREIAHARQIAVD